MINRFRVDSGRRAFVNGQGRVDEWSVRVVDSDVI